MEWFPRAGAEHGFTYTSTNNWNLLADSAALTQYQVVLFLDDAPQSAAQRSGFEAYMRGGGAWMGFHVAAFTTSAQNWPWYHNQFLGSGNFATNTWGPTTATLHTDHSTHPSTGHLHLVGERVVQLEPQPADQPRHRRPGLGGPGELPAGHRPQPQLVQR